MSKNMKDAVMLLLAKKKGDKKDKSSDVHSELFGALRDAIEDGDDQAGAKALKDFIKGCSNGDGDASDDEDGDY